MLLLFASSGFPALAQQRVALVIGNSGYMQAPPLPNPVNDATAIAALLQSAGFQVFLRRDVSINDMRRATRVLRRNTERRCGDFENLVLKHALLNIL